MSSEENRNLSSKKLSKTKSKIDKNAIANVGNQICKVIIPQLSPGKSSIKKKSNEQNKKANKIKTGKKATKYSIDLSFKDLNNHFNNNHLNTNINTNTNRKQINSNDNDLEENCKFEENLHQFIGVDYNQQKLQELDSSNESSLCSFDLSVQSDSSISDSSASSISEQELNHENLECHKKELKICAKKSFIEQSYRIKLEQNNKFTMYQQNGQLNNTINYSNEVGSLMNNQISCQSGSQLGNHSNCQIIGQNNVNNQMNSQINYGQVQSCQNYLLKDIGMNSNYSPSHLSCSNPNHQPNLNTTAANNVNFNNFNNFVSLANQFKMTNRVSAVENKQVNKLYLNSVNEKSKLTVQNNLYRQASFTYSNNPIYPNNYNLTNNNSNHGYQQQNSLERNSHLKNLSAFLSRNKHLNNNMHASDDFYSDSESNSNKFDHLNKKNKCSNLELLNKNLNRPISISQQNSPSHINYKEKLCCQTKMNHMNWSKLNENNQLNQLNYSNQFNQNNKKLDQQQPFGLTQYSQPDAYIKTTALSLENLNNQFSNNNELVQVNKQIDCLNNNLYWNERKESELNYLSTSQTMPSPSRLKQQTNANSLLPTSSNATIPSLTNLSTTTTNNSSTNLDSNLQSINSINLVTNSTNKTIDNYSLTLPLDESNNQLNRASPTNGKYSMNELSKLRKDLQQSNQKVGHLTEQLNTNAQMVSAFEQNLYTMTNRIHQLTKLSNEKENELNQLKLLVTKLLDVDDLKSNDINQLLDNLNKDEFMEEKDRNLKINASKQLIRRHTFTANEMQSNLSKCKSLETCASAKLVPINDQQSSKSIKKTQNESIVQLDVCDSPKASSSWLKLTKAFKKTPLAKYSPMHKVYKNENLDKNRAGSLIREKDKPNEDTINTFDTVKNNQLENDDILLINLNSDPFNSDHQLSLEHQKLKKELDEKEKQICDLRLEALTNQHQLDNLKIELLNIKSENDRLNKLSKDKSLMSSKVSLFSVNSSTCNESIGNQSINNISNINLTAQSPSDSVHTLTTVTSTSTNNLSSSFKNLQPFHNNLITSSITPNEQSYLEQQLNNSDNLLQNIEQKQSSNELSNALSINNSSSNSSRINEEQLTLSNRESYKNPDKHNCNDILGEGKLVSVQLRPDNDKAMGKQHSFKQQPNQTKLNSSLSNEIGLLRISRKTSWSSLDQNLKELIDDYLNMIDCNQLLGLSSNSIYSYELGGSFKKISYLNLDQNEFEDARNNDKLPYDYLDDDSNLVIELRFKSMLESFAMINLIPKSFLLRLTNLLSDNKRLILCGPAGTGKTLLAHKLSEYLIYKLNHQDFSTKLCQSNSLLSNGSGSLNSNYSIDSSKSLNRSETNELNNCSSKIPVGSIATFFIDKNNYSNLYHYLNDLVQQCDQQSQNHNQVNYCNIPSFLIIDNLQFISNIDETFSVFQSQKHSNYMPYIIGTLNQDKSDKSKLFAFTNNNSNVIQSTNNFRVLTFTNQNELVCGFLSRFLRKKVVSNLIEKKYQYLNEFNLLNIEERNLKDQSLKSLESVLADLEKKKDASFKVIDWLESILKHINHFIEQFHSIPFGPRIFIDCPINDLDKVKEWFSLLWNDLIQPELLEIVNTEIKQPTSNQTTKTQFEDPSIFVLKTYPFLSYEASSKNQFCLKRLDLDHTRSNVKNLDPLRNALTNLNKLTNQ